MQQPPPSYVLQSVNSNVCINSFSCSTGNFVTEILYLLRPHVELSSNTDSFVILNHIFDTYHNLQNLLQLHGTDIQTLTLSTIDVSDFLLKSRSSRNSFANHKFLSFPPLYLYSFFKKTFTQPQISFYAFNFQVKTKDTKNHLLKLSTFLSKKYSIQNFSSLIILTLIFYYYLLFQSSFTFKKMQI